jgi:peroxiredoxin
MVRSGKMLHKEKTMSKISLNMPAPDFALDDFQGCRVRLSDFRGRKQVVLVFNRGFA